MPKTRFRYTEVLFAHEYFTLARKISVGNANDFIRSFVMPSVQEIEKARSKK